MFQDLNWLHKFENPIYIYELIDPRDNLPKYIGKTNNPRRRYGQHMTMDFSNNSKKGNWIKKLISLDLKPLMRIIYIASNNDIGNSIEIDKIKKYREIYDLKNCTDGGSSNTLSESHKEKIRLLNKLRCTGKKLSEKHKLAISMSQKGKPKKKWSEETYIKQGCKKVIGTNVKTGQEFEFRSATEAARLLNLHETPITNCCKNRPHFKTSGGYKWRYK